LLPGSTSASTRSSRCSSRPSASSAKTRPTAPRGRKNQNRRGNPCGPQWRSIVRALSPSSRCTSTPETWSETMPTHATMSGCDPKKWIDAVRCVPWFNSVPASPPPNQPSLPRANSSPGPTGPCSHHLPSGPGAVTKAGSATGRPQRSPRPRPRAGRRGAAPDPRHARSVAGGRLLPRRRSAISPRHDRRSHPWRRPQPIHSRLSHRKSQ
jgi:hypothetical protein